MEVNPINKQRFNLAGVIPVDGQSFDFNFPWHDSLMPIGQNYLAIEKAVFDCAMAGCDTIWLACPKDIQPLLRHRLGDYVVDPYYYYKELQFGKYPKIKEIPIYYVPIHPKDDGRRNSLAWSIFTGAHNAWVVSRKMSRWIAPDKYFVSFPYGMFSPYYMRGFRTKIRSEVPFAASFEGKTFKDGLFLPFTFDGEDYIATRKRFRTKEKRTKDKDFKPIPVEERFSGRFFSHDYIFKGIKQKDLAILELPWYYDVSSWEKLKIWFSSDNTLDKPKDFILSYNKLNPLGKDFNEEE